MYEKPNNGDVECNYSAISGGHFCSVTCNEDFEFERKPASFYICLSNGNWFVWDIDPNVDLSMPWPDCICK